MIRHWFAIFVLPFCVSAAVAQQRPVNAGATPTPGGIETAVDTDPRLAQVQAATANGEAVLREQVLRVPLTRNCRVRDFVDKTQSADGLTQALSTAEAVGGPRWVDEQTCQVQLEIPGSRVAVFLQNVARDKADQSPLAPDAMARRATAIGRMKFSAVGSSTGGDSIELATPHDTVGKWSGVSDRARGQAVGRARIDATLREVETLTAIHLDETRQVKDAMSQPVIADRVTKWIDHQPVTKIEFRDDLRVSVTVNLSPKMLVRVLKAAVINDASFIHSGSAIDWDRVKKDIEATPDLTVGTATPTVPAPSSLPSIVLPLQPPDWVGEQLNAEATAHGTGSQLVVGRAAEAAAAARIKDEFLDLRLDSATTMRDAAKSDPQIRDAIARAMRLAHTYKIDYQPGGIVRVRVSLDLRDVWDELRSSP